eukprot:COSAG06_NODE_2854_length_6170_cov_10.221216_1_plen_22_part_10
MPLAEGKGYNPLRPPLPSPLPP